MATTTSTWTQIAALVRDQIGDLDAVRWGDTKLMRYFGSLRAKFLGERPEAGYVDEVERHVPAAVTSMSEECGILMEYEMDFVHVVAATCMAEDSEDAANLRVANYHDDKAPEDLVR